MKHKKHSHHKKNMKQRLCIIVGCIAFAALCFLTLFSQYTSDVTELQGAAILKNKCDTTPSTYVVFGSDDNNLYALDADKGCIIWKFDAGADIKSKPTIYGTTVYVGTATDELYAISLADGTKIWDVDTNKIYGAVAADSNYAYAGDISGTLGAYAGTDPILSYKGHNIYTDVQLDNNLLYIVDEYSKVGTVRAISATTFTQKWAFSAKSQILAAPLITSDALYVSSNENTLYKINKQYGVALWTFKTSKSIRSTPVADDTGTVFFGSNDGYFYAVNAGDGKLVWKYHVNAEITASAALDSSNVYVGSQNKNVYALNKKTGVLVWQAKTNGKIYGGLTVHDNTLYVPSSDNSLYALDTASGKVLWSYATKGVLYAGVALS